MNLSLNRPIPTLFLIFCTFLINASCHKTASTPPPPVFTVDNTWQCQVDGVSYSGTIDTCFTQLDRIDTAISCNGTSADKKANIHFLVRINRGLNGGTSTFSTLTNGQLFFDTSSAHLLQTGISAGPSINYQVDTF